MAISDELYIAAIQLVSRRKLMNAIIVQREFTIGYNGAAAILAMLQADRLVSCADETGQRAVLAGHA